jgi:hypothetical protein
MTAARLKAAQANAQKSSGPHDTSNTRFNGLKHGMCTTVPVAMPGEDPNVLERKINRYITQHGAETEAECDAAELAALCYVRFKRCHGADLAAETQVVSDVAGGFDTQQVQRLAELLPNLATAPAATMAELATFSFGLLHALEQVGLLEAHLQSSPSFHPGQRDTFIHLCGCRPSELFTSEVVKDIDVNYLSGLHGRGKLTAEDLALIFQNDRPEQEIGPEEFVRRLKGWLPELVDQRDGRARLKELVAALKADLGEALAAVLEREKADRERAIEAAKVSVNHQCMLRLRYMSESRRGWKAGLDQLHQMRSIRLKEQAESGESGTRSGGPSGSQAEPSAPSEPAAAAPEAGKRPPEPAEEVAQRTEAAAPQVDGGHRGKGEPQAYSFVDIAIGRPDGGSAGQGEVNEVQGGPGFDEFLSRRE